MILPLIRPTMRFQGGPLLTCDTRVKINPIPELDLHNPWSRSASNCGTPAVVKNGLGNLAGTGVDHLAAVISNRLKRIQYRPELFDGFLTQTGLTLDPETTTIELGSVNRRS
jgi:hypothetical protein